jgi:hydrogenase-4 membrane subunit HyfE
MILRKTIILIYCGKKKNEKQNYLLCACAMLFKMYFAFILEFVAKRKRNNKRISNIVGKKIFSFLTILIIYSVGFIGLKVKKNIMLRKRRS